VGGQGADAFLVLPDFHFVVDVDGAEHVVSLRSAVRSGHTDGGGGRMEFDRVKLGDLEELVEDGGGYPGGSNLTDFEEFKLYIEGKKLTPTGRKKAVSANSAYEVCSYSVMRNARAAEDRLLRTCVNGSCPYNTQKLSNLQDAPGFVYVLHD